MYDAAMNVHTKAPDLTRQKLLEAAFAEIHRNGFQAASLTQILADTGSPRVPCITISRTRRRSVWRSSKKSSGPDWLQ